ncbi:MAG: type IX secretion system outer membrane channel protein PorV [Muribaculaceae bacterium]|nr:type IX secretion system outer membrane channel protein PorV [Muribaculaceae bacterium]
MMKIIRHSLAGAAAVLAVAFVSAPGAQADDNIKNEFNPIQTGVTSLSIAPDARGASMGDLGAATDPDANSQFWNPSKYAFAYSQAAVSLSYTPWLRKLVNDIFLANLAGYWKIGSDDNQAISASLRYFSLGEVNSNDLSGVTTSLNPYEMSVDLGYSRKLSEKFSMGVVFRYIYSDLGFNTSDVGDNSTGASAFAADIAGYYTTYPIIGQNECQWSWGFNVSNIGSKVAYDNGNRPAFLPTNLKLGTTFMFPLADYHTLALSLDLNKLLVPTRPRQQDYVDADGVEDQFAYQEALQNWEDMSPISGIFKSFSDAPGGMKEELREITYSLGAEYSYNQQFFLRAGYYHESEFKGNRQYFGFGAGFSLNVVRLDASYMLATAQTSPLDQTLRFTLTFDMDGLKDLFGGRR